VAAVTGRDGPCRCRIPARDRPGFTIDDIQLAEVNEAFAALVHTLLTEVHESCELMDLVGDDVNHAITRSVFNTFYQDPRYDPLALQRELVDAGCLGEK
jgi:3-hydroxybutyryl-CoA dehydrogenase